MPAPLPVDDSFRRPAPDPIEAFDLPHPLVPEALDGLTILHVSDLHLRRHAPRSHMFEFLARALAGVEVDLLVFTGDLMDAPGHEQAVIDTLSELLPRARVRTPGGMLCVFGNHDSPCLRRALPAALPSLTCMDHRAIDLVIPRFGGRTLRVLGLSWPEDPVGAMLRCPDAAPPLLTLAHHPTCLIACAELGLPIVLAGHTHAGQVRVSSRLAPHTSSDVPAHLATGLLRLRQSLMAISRGVGDGVVEGLRINCPRQTPLYTLRAAPMPAPPRDGSTRVVTQVRAW